ncbi:MAG: epoxyqueuosine reductase [Pseudohongiellaceae bacterium]|jgi:epoxyqueuosine reductase
MTRRIDGEAREALRQLFADQGFAAVGFTHAGPLDDQLSPWVASGQHASMDYLARDPALRADPTFMLPEARSVICVAAAYPASDGTGHIAGYARGEDYHRTMKAALREAVAQLPRLLGYEPATRVCVDTAPLLERALAARAGLGWIGRNTLLLNEKLGPWALLGEVLTDLEIAPDEPRNDHCGSCTACVEACPTGALDGERHLDARACLSYWTIEHRGEIPESWAKAADYRVFGCDDCLSACPYPQQTPELASPGPYVPRGDLVSPTLDELEARATESFRKHFSTTPVERARRRGLLRNIAMVRGTLQSQQSSDASQEPRTNEPDV